MTSPVENEHGHRETEGPRDAGESRTAPLHRRAVRWFGWFVVAVVFGYFFIAQLSHLGSSRSLTGVRLEEAEYEEVFFENTDAGIGLGGMLFRPEGEGPFPAAVVIHGSGESRRRYIWYLTLASYLREHGIAVLLPDKRGSESSEGDWRTASFEDLARDALAGVAFIRGVEWIEEGRVGLIGLSQGGHIAPLAASLSSDVDFVVNVVGAALPMHDVLVYEEVHNLRQMGIVPGLSDLMAPVTAWTLIHLRDRELWSSVGNFDPRPYWRRLAVEGLVLYGEDDTNVPSARSAEELEALGNPRIRVKIYEGSGHALEDPPERGNSIFREDALAEIREFIVV